MRKPFSFLLFVSFWFSPALLRAEVRTMTMREAVALALKQNPDIVIARYEQAKARAAVQIARDPFVPKVIGGSGAAFTSGYPASINGQPPSIFAAQTLMSIYNKPQSYKVAEARENSRGAEIEITRQQDEVAFRTASMWLDVRQTAEALDVAQRQIDSLKKLNETITVRVQEGRAIPLDAKRAALDLARVEQRAEAWSTDLESAEAALANMLGFAAGDRVQASKDDQPQPELPASEDSSIERAIGNNKELKTLESRMHVKELEIQEYKGARLPVIDLVAQYNLLARYNFQDFFGTFQRNNGQLGISVTLPLLVGSAPRGYLNQAEAELARLQTLLRQKRGQITLDTRKSFAQIRKAETSRNVARLDLDVAREQVNVLLAQQEEGRVSLKEVEQARLVESDKWIAYYDSLHSLERAKLDVLRQTGTLVAALQ